MKHSHQIILGAGGVIGTLLARELKKYTDQIYLYSKNPKKVNEDDVLIKGNLSDSELTARSLYGKDIAYLVVGVKYSTKEWQKEWPVIIKNVIAGCKKHNTKLVFLDNIYMYDAKHLSKLTELTPIHPISKKGLVRAVVTEELLKAMKSGEVRAVIARSADFYGGNTKQSVFNELILNPIIHGKKATWFLDANKKHSFTYVKDIAYCLAVLGNTESAYNEIWHLPTDKPYTINELVLMTSQITGNKGSVSVVPKFIIKLLALFTPIIQETNDILYQYEDDYVFDSTKIDHLLNLSPTPIGEGIKESIRSH